MAIQDIVLVFQAAAGAIARGKFGGNFRFGNLGFIPSSAILLRELGNEVLRKLVFCFGEEPCARRFNEVDIIFIGH